MEENILNINTRIETIKNNLEELKRRVNEINQNLEQNRFTASWDIDAYEYDPDSSPLAWTYYLNTYTNAFLKKYDFNEFFIEKDDKRTVTFWIEDFRPQYKRICGTFKYDAFKLELTNSLLDIKEKHNIGIAGDCCFNFNEKKVGLFATLLCNETVTTVRNNIMDLVFSFHEMHYSPLNLALMPINGGLNKFKGYDKFDRLSFLLYRINEFYNNNSIQIFSAGKGEPMDALNDFLSEFKKNKEIKYHTIFYPEINEELYNRLLENGKKETLKNTQDVIEYLELAIDFWTAKADYYDAQVKKSK